MYVLAILAAEEDGGNASGGLIQIGILLLIPLAMYFLMIRPQRKRMRDQQAMQTSLEVGDEVMTASGIYGFITGFEEDIVWVEIDDDVQIRLARAAIQNKVDTSATPTPPAGPSEVTDDGDATDVDGRSAEEAPELTDGRAERPTSKRGRAARDDAE